MMEYAAKIMELPCLRYFQIHVETWLKTLITSPPLSVAEQIGH